MIFVGLKVSVRPLPCGGRLFCHSYSAACISKAALGEGDDRVLVDLGLEPAQVLGLLDLGKDVVRREPRVLGAVVEEPLEGLEIELVGRRAERDLLRRAGGGVIGAGVTEGAVRLDARIADLAAGEADRQILPLLIDHAERGPAAGAGQQVRADLGQHVPDHTRGSGSPC